MKSVLVLVGMLMLGISSLIAPSPAIAHHSFSAVFDSNKPVTLEGTVTKLDWFNPHIWIYLTVEESDGTSAAYQCESSSPNALRRRGWSRDTLKPGDHITIEGLAARKDPYSCSARSIKLADGTRLFSGTAEETE